MLRDVSSFEACLAHFGKLTINKVEHLDELISSENLLTSFCINRVN